MGGVGHQALHIQAQQSCRARPSLPLGGCGQLCPYPGHRGRHQAKVCPLALHAHIAVPDGLQRDALQQRAEEGEMVAAQVP